MEQFFDYCAQAGILAAIAAAVLLSLGLWWPVCWILLLTAGAGPAWYIGYQRRQFAIGLKYHKNPKGLWLACALPLLTMISVPVMVLIFFKVLTQQH